MNKKWLLTTVGGAVLGAIVVYQLKKRTSGIVDD
jgi:hypothetical protein|tara:strand:+ start:1704 stop:1805 length:102 start_codon:yes stop_codon:yes gene_type:complete